MRCFFLAYLRYIKILFLSVLTYCEFLGIPCLLLVSFTDSELPDSITLSGFQSLFKVPEIRSLNVADVKTSQARLKKLVSLQQKDNLFV